MDYIATFDLGTTALKGALVSEYGEILHSCSLQISTIYGGDKLKDGGSEHKEQSPIEWFETFCKVSRRLVSELNKNTDKDKEIVSVIFSGQMQNTILVDKDGRNLMNSILYSDARAEAEAKEIIGKIGLSEIYAITKNNFDGSLPICKALWIKNNYPEIYKRIHKILISPKDYLIYKLTGKFCSDVVSCATSGAMVFNSKIWSREIIEQSGNLLEHFPDILYPEEIAGYVTIDANEQTGLPLGVKVYVGTGDAGATTLASGITDSGDISINLGTSGWVAVLSRETVNMEGVFNLPAVNKGFNINIVPLLNAGNVYSWAKNIFSKDEDEHKNLEYVISHSEVGSGGVMFLPYLLGERFPIMDGNIKGAFIGITASASRSDMARATLEGVAMSIRQGLETMNKLDKAINKVSLIGGGAQSPIWCQILADLLDRNIYVYNNSDILPAIAISAIVMASEKKIQPYDNFLKALKQDDKCIIYKPNKLNSNTYFELYNKYLKIYPAIKQI